MQYEITSLRDEGVNHPKKMTKKKERFRSSFYRS